MREDLSPRMLATRAGPMPKANRQFGTGRECAEDGCTTPLSRYNPFPRCDPHQPLRFRLVRGKRSRKE